MESSDSVLSAKEKLAVIKDCDASLIKFVFSGKVLQTDKLFESYGIKEDDQIIFMISRVKPKAAPAAQPAAQPAATDSPAPVAAAAPVVEESTPAAETASASPAPAETESGAPAAPVASEEVFAQGSAREAAIANLVAMGFERVDVERALLAAFNNPDRAVEYLLNGFPESVREPQAHHEQEEQLPGEGESAADTPAATESATTNAAPAPSGNLFEQAEAQQGNRSTGAAGGMDNDGMMGQLRDIIQNQPELAEVILQQLAASNPQMGALIQENPEAFLRYITEGDSSELAQSLGVPMEDIENVEMEVDNEGDEQAGDEIQIRITQEENEAINRLCELGFDRNTVIQVYFACDKNEEMTANLLFSEYAD